LPGTTFVEKDGTFTNTDRRIQQIRQAVEPLGDSRYDWAIIADLAERMSGAGNSAPYAGWEYDSPAAIMDEIAALTPIYGGASYVRLEQEGDLQWPIPTADHPGTPYLHKDRFSRGLGHFSAVAFKEPAEAPDEEYPLTLTTGRIMFHYHTGSMTRRSEKLDREVPEGYVEVSPEDAGRLGLGKSQTVRVLSRRGEIETKAWITRRVPPGVVFIPFHFAEAAANVLTNNALDPVAKIPEYKVCAVRLEAA
jgi:predicted molibdopterin-dependent oxidoreductase YjgC